MAPTNPARVEKSTKMHSKVVSIHRFNYQMAWIFIEKHRRSSSAPVQLGTPPRSILRAQISTRSCSKDLWPMVSLLVVNLQPPRMVRTRLGFTTGIRISIFFC